jgi:hypothetical protein
MANLFGISFFEPIVAGVALIIVGFIAAKVYHEWWLSEQNWSGNILGTTSRFDRAIEWLPYLGFMLIASAILWEIIGFLVSLF